MGKFKKLFIYAAAMIFLVASAGYIIADQSKVVLVGGGQAYRPLDDFLMEGELIGAVAGDSWYVDSGKTASGDGKSWDYAVKTLDEAINLCTEDNGDVIHVAPGHEETITTAAIVVPDVDGITVIGYGEGRQRPTFTWEDTTPTTFPISAADVKFVNMVFDGSSTANDGPAAMFTVTAAGFQLIGSEIITGDSTEAATLVITGNAAADRMKVIGNRFYGSTDTGTTAAITFTGQATDIEIAYNTFEGDYSSAAIHSATVITQVNVHHNYIFNYQDDDHAIEFSEDATGIIAYNQLVTDAYLTAIDAGACDVFETYWANDEVPDTMGTQVLVNEDGYAPWSAISLAVMQLQVDEALVEEALDHLCAFADGALAYPGSVLDDSIMGFILASDLVTSYNRTTDSLEAIGTAVALIPGSGNSQTFNSTALASIQTEATSAIVADDLDHLLIAGAGTNAYPSNVDDDSVVGFILATDNVTSYDRTTDSLEALATNLAVGTGAIVALESFELDELLDDSVTGNIQTAVDDDSVAGYIMAVANVTSYSRASDSLEAIGTDVDTIIAATLAATIEAQANAALVDEELDHLVALADGSAAYPGTPVDNSIVGYILAVANVTSYNRTTDSLEAIGTDTDALISTDTAQTASLLVQTNASEKAVTYAAAALPATTATAIFIVNTGPCEIVGLMGYVTVGMDAATNNLKLIANPTIGSDTDLCTNLDVTGDVAGTTYSLSTSVGTALQEATNGVDEGMGAFSIIIPVGTIDLNTSSTQATGRVQWHIRYKPLHPGATITSN